MDGTKGRRIESPNILEPQEIEGDLIDLDSSIAKEPIWVTDGYSLENRIQEPTIAATINNRLVTNFFLQKGWYEVASREPNNFLEESTTGNHIIIWKNEELENGQTVRKIIGVSKSTKEAERLSQKPFFIEQFFSPDNSTSVFHPANKRELIKLGEFLEVNNIQKYIVEDNPQESLRNITVLVDADDWCQFATTNGPSVIDIVEATATIECRHSNKHSIMILEEDVLPYIFLELERILNQEGKFLFPIAKKRIYNEETHEEKDTTMYCSNNLNFAQYLQNFSSKEKRKLLLKILRK